MLSTLRLRVGQAFLRLAFKVLGTKPPTDEAEDEEPDYDVAVPMVTMNDRAKEMLREGMRAEHTPSPKQEHVPLKGSLEERWAVQLKGER